MIQTASRSSLIQSTILLTATDRFRIFSSSWKEDKSNPSSVCCKKSQYSCWPDPQLCQGLGHAVHGTALGSSKRFLPNGHLQIYSEKRKLGLVCISSEALKGFSHQLLDPADTLLGHRLCPSQPLCQLGPSLQAPTQFYMHYLSLLLSHAVG